MKISTEYSKTSVLQLVADIEDEASGITTAVRAFVNSLRSLGTKTAIVCLKGNRHESPAIIKTFSPIMLLGRFPFSLSFLFQYRRIAKDYQIIHNHGLWSIVNFGCGILTPFAHTKLVVSPHGTLALAAFAVSSLRKKIFWPLQKLALTRATLIHVTSEEEYFQVRALGISTPVLVARNGVEIPKTPKSLSIETEKTRSLLYLGRIHPIKGIDQLLRSWAEIQDRHPKWALTIAGPGEDAYVKELQDLTGILGCRRVTFCGPKFGAERADLYFNSDLFVLPSHSENFGMVVAEALAHGIPAIVSNKAPWSGVEDYRCGWWVEPSGETLERTLTEAMSMPAERLFDMGIQGREWMIRDFSWAASTTLLSSAYSWLAEDGAPPVGIRFD